MNCLDTSSLEMLINVCLSEDKFEPFNKGAIVRFVDPDGRDITTTHLDYNIADDTHRYGVIRDSDNYSSGFNPYFYKMNVDMFDLTENNEVTMTNFSIYTSELEHASGDIVTGLYGMLDKVGMTA